jgi:iron complex transport system substrate-binding protein
MRIASLVPSATEALYALGLGDSVVAVTHECDHPAEVTALPKLTSSVIDDGLEPAEIDRKVREVTARGESLYRLDEDVLEHLDTDLILTQALCAVCAVSYDDVRAVAARLPTTPEVVSLDPQTLEEVLGDIRTIAVAAGEPARGEHRIAVLRDRLDGVGAAVAGAARPRVAALEWLDPVFIGGHWVPEMIEVAGGTDVLGTAGERSKVVSRDELVAARPEIVVAMPCGLYAAEAAAQVQDHGEWLRSLGAQRIVAVDAAASFSRPGPRLVDGVELLAHLLHPDVVDSPPGLSFETVWEGSAQ